MRSSRPEREVRVACAQTDLAWLNHGRIPALDGFRGVAIGLVLLCHVGHSAGWQWAEAGRPFAFGGLVGVDLFFLISGFLITTLLTREVQATGRVDLRAFYLRRCLRILPASFGFLIFIATMASWGLCRIDARDWAATLCYVANFVPGLAKPIEHFWSLSIEEQFYLVWPPLFATLVAHRRGGATVALVSVVLVMAPGTRLATLQFFPEYYGVSRWWTPNRIDAIAAGCLLALLARRPVGVLQLDRFARYWPAFAAVCFGLQVVGGRRLAIGLASIVPTFEVAALAGLVWTAMRSAHWVLNRGPLPRLGVLSYSIYLWQQPFLIPDRSRWWSSWPQNLVLALACGLASHSLIERPFLKLKGRSRREFTSCSEANPSNAGPI